MDRPLDAAAANVARGNEIRVRPAGIRESVEVEVEVEVQNYSFCGQMP
jgi:hypothetical protein